MNWFFYALATPALYSVTNFIDKFLIEKKIKEPILIISLSGFISFVLGIIIFLVRGFRFFEPTQIGLIVFAGIILDFYLLPYFKALKIDDASRIVPLFQFVPVFVLVMSYLFLKEVLTIDQLVGFVLILCGGFILSVKKVEGKIFKPRLSFWYMIAASFLYALVGVIFRFVVRVEDFWTTLAYQYFGMGIGAVALLIFFLTKNRYFKIVGLKSSMGIMVVNSGIAILAQMAEVYAISLVPVAFVSIVGGVQPLFVLLFGIMLSMWFPKIIKEDISKSVVGIKLLSILLIFIGLYFIYF
jgi:uncharacterized membrane protein